MPTRIKLLLAALITAGLGIFVALAFMGGGGGGCRLPDGVVEVFPDCNTSVLGQTRVGVRVETGYAAELALNGVPIPLDQVTTGSGQTPRDDVGVAPTEFSFFPPIDGELALDPTNTMTVTYWPLIDGMDAARSFNWTFSAA